MALTSEWMDRVNLWRRELGNHFYRSLGPVNWIGFTTLSRLTPRQALRGSFKPMPPDAKWGAKWEYGWFKTRIKLPREAAGKRIAAYLTGCESVVFLNGRVLTGQSWPAHLAFRGRPGQVFELLMESYAGHGPMVCSAGPLPPGRESVPEPPATQATVQKSTFGIWEDEVYQLHIDVETLFGLRNHLDQDSLRVAEIDEGLRDFTLLVDFELPREQMLKTVAAARKRLSPLLACVNGSTVPTMYAFGHAHLDTAWLWPLQQSERKIARTIANQLELAHEYGRHKFIFSQPLQYTWLRDGYPELYARLKTAVRAGHIVPEGGMWVEADTNISGGEALVRQFLHGKRFFRDEFGVDSRLLWLPDVFGYSAALPQIMKGCGVDYFSTSKIFWLYHGGERFEHNHFMWRGIDGSETLTFLHEDYNSNTDPGAVISRWNNRPQKNGLATFLFPFGLGDGGGGPNRGHMEYLRRLENIEGAPRLKLAHPVSFFRDLDRRGTSNRHVGELYFQAHRGTYTSQARTKRGNRKSELGLREAEMWGSLATALRRFRYPAREMDGLWKTLLCAQFHDILPGSSIHRVYEEAESAHAQVIQAAAAVRDRAQSALLKRRQRTVTVFNSLNWARRAVVELPADMKRPCGAAGVPLPVQRSGRRLLAEVNAPACGWTAVREGRTAWKPERNAVRATARSLENELILARFNGAGELTSILDKATGREILAGPANRLLLYKDLPSQWDAWDIDSMYCRQQVAIEPRAEISVAMAGPLAASLRVTRRVNQSSLVQAIVLRRGGRRLDFVTEVDWRETHKMLKVSFPVNVRADEAVHEIQFGHIRRSNHGSREYDRQRFEVCNHKWTALAESGHGCAVLNDCKYGVNVVDNSINLTLLRSPAAPDMTADKGGQQFTYAFYSWNGTLPESGVVREAYDLNCPAGAREGDGGEAAMFETDAPGIVIEAVKPAEDARGDIIVRLYECMNATVACKLATPLPVSAAFETNMIEEGGVRLPVKGGIVSLSFRPFEIKTLRLKLRT